MMIQNKMNLDFEPTILGITVLVLSISQINEALQSLLLLATIVYTIIKIYQLIKNNLIILNLYLGLYTLQRVYMIVSV